MRRNLLFNTVGSLTYQGCLWLTTVLVVVLSSGYNDSGLLAFAMTVGNMFNPIATYSMRPYQVSDASGEHTQGSYVGFRLTTLLLGIAFIVPYTFVTTSDPATIGVVFVYLIFKVDEAFCDVLYGVDQCAERMDYIGISQFMRGIVLVASFSAGLVLLNSLSLAIIAMSVCCMAVTFAYDIPHASHISSLRPRIDRSEVWGLLKSCLPLVISTFLMSSIVSVARQWFSNSYGTEALGLYAAVATPAVLVQAAARYLYAPALVPLSEKWRDEPRAFVTAFAKTAKIMLIACVGMVIVFSLVGGPVLKLVYGESIADYTYLFPLVLVGTALLAFGWFLSDVLVLCRSLYGMLCEAGIAMAVALVVMIPLETMYGMDGINYTVIVAALSGVMAALLCIRHAYRKTWQQSR
ncbi:MAG: oligosaccharide flippase family protein [Atopobiaceae bacterium]|nr:oligosaccharide flippase family protein [Atopobiaceae bacterium]MCH4214313.1 oligosaccharide flippase family protein [Atopobiaceae bacterium]MCI1259842.1 oligosaccharide flippase family protein [Atopobiaceae bacterium]MDD3177323.1 oligosaccharide flippase family protein [Atopobiaceae bacterium]MDD4381499.1 oligosaccharide flippase family protein [Atopobiaceae bacterium]